MKQHYGKREQLDEKDLYSSTIQFYDVVLFMPFMPYAAFEKRSKGKDSISP